MNIIKESSRSVCRNFEYSYGFVTKRSYTYIDQLDHTHKECFFRYMDHIRRHTEMVCECSGQALSCHVHERISHLLVEGTHLQHLNSAFYNYLTVKHKITFIRMMIFAIIIVSDWIVFAIVNGSGI